jgi:hypothetical protein
VIYGVDVSDLPGLLIADILKRVCFSGYFRHEEGVWVNDDSAENLRAENPQANDTQWSQQLMEAWEDAARQRIAAGEIREYSYKAVSKAHKSNSRAMLWILTTSMIAAAALGMLLLSGLAAVLFEFRPKGVYLVRVEYFYWMLPSMFIGLCASVPLYFWLLEKRTGMRIQELLIFERIVQGFSGWGLTKILLGLVMTGSLLFVVLGLNTYTRFDQDHIAFSELLEWRERRYSYREVEGIYAVSNVRTKAGRVIDAFHYVLVLTDGRTWSTRREDRESNPVGDKRLIEFVSMKSGVFIQYVDFYDGGIP